MMSITDSNITSTDTPVQAGQAQSKDALMEADALKLPKLKKRGENATTMTLAISLEDKRTVKAYAARNCTTVSDLFHLWITQHCVME